MTRSIPLTFALAALLAACAQSDQSLPLMAPADAADGLTEGVVAADGGTLTSAAAGLSVRFPAGALPSATTVRLRLGPAVALAAGSGTAAGARAVSLTPSDAELRLPAELQFDAGAAPGRASEAWLTSVLLVGPDGASVLADLAVDGTNHIARAKLPSLGALVPFIPEPSQYLVATAAARTTATAAAAPRVALAAGAAPLVDQLGRRSCGHWRVASVDVGGGAASRATYLWSGCDRVSLAMDAALGAHLGTLALQFVTVEGVLTAAGNAALNQPVPVSGSLRVGGVFRSPRQLASVTAASSATSFALSVRIETTPESRLVQLADAVVLQNVRYTSQETSADGSSTLEQRMLDVAMPIVADGASATLSVTRSVPLPGGTSGAASVSVVLDLKGGCGSGCAFDR